MKKIIITYISFGQYKDHETWAFEEKEKAEKRIEQLKNCKHISNLKAQIVVG